MAGRIPLKRATQLMRPAVTRHARPLSTVQDIYPSGGGATPPPSPNTAAVVEEALNSRAPRMDWTRDEIREIYNTPLMELAFKSVSLNSPYRTG